MDDFVCVFRSRPVGVKFARAVSFCIEMKILDQKDDDSSLGSADPSLEKRGFCCDQERKNNKKGKKPDGKKKKKTDKKKRSGDKSKGGAAYLLLFGRFRH